ncbi:unnamed protein product, partial [Amoebophrya sp. A25]
WIAVAEAIRESLYDDKNEIGDPERTWGPKYIRNCVHSCLTYCKHTDTGGLEGATMRFAPESTEAHNRGLPAAHRRLDRMVKRKFPWISYSDLFAVSACVAIECAGGPAIPLAVGRLDSDGRYLVLPGGGELGQEENNTKVVKPPIQPGRLPYAEYGEYEDEASELVLITSQMRKKLIDRVGLTDQMLVCLICGGHAFGRCHKEVSGYRGPWQATPGVFNNSMAKNLLNEKWRLVNSQDLSSPGNSPVCPHGIRRQYVNDNEDMMMLMSDMCLLRTPTWRKWLQIYAEDEQRFREDFAIFFKQALELG